MPFGKSVGGVCHECGEQFIHLKKLSEHIKKAHKLSSIDYYVKHNHNGARPACLHCGQETRFVSLGDGFKKYCLADRKIAEATAGKVGGKNKKTWNKDLTKETDQRIAATAIKTSGPGNSFYGRHHTTETLEKIAVTKRLLLDELERRAFVSGALITSDYSSYNDQNSTLNVKCKNCGSDDETTLLNLQRCWRCRTCSPIGSRQQTEVADYVKSLGLTDVQVSTRHVIPPFELDIWVPSKNLAIEYHGLYWHSGGKDGTFDKRRHRQKYLACQAKNIKLIQFFSDEWLIKGDTCRSMISNALGVNMIKLNARDCVITVLTQKESKTFADTYHISGATKARHHFGLVHKKFGLVGLATTRTPIQKKHGNVCELARMCFKHGTNVRGGASKLLSHVKKTAKQDGFEGLLSYAELRYGNGSVYEKCGLSLVGEALNNYWYTDGCVRYDRFKFRARPGIPEKIVAETAGVRPIWGCGNKTYLAMF